MNDELIAAVREQIGDDADSYFEDITNHGADAGFPGFTLYAETCKFYDEHADEIWDLLTDTAQEMGLTELELIASFNGAKSVGTDEQFKNLLAWFALEEVARYVVDNGLVAASDE